MRVFIEPEVRVIRAGIEAKTTQPRLAGHGADNAQAVAILVEAITAWCYSLQRRGELEAALTNIGVRWEPGDGRIEVIAGAQA
jgi:hypothetical protein